MTRENVSTPIFDQLLREMSQRAEPQPPAQAKEPDAEKKPTDRPNTGQRRRHRAE
jgi:hypothetical protein